MFIILNTHPTLANWAGAIKFVSKSGLIECTEINAQLCQLLNTLNIEDVIIRVSSWSYNCKKSPFEIRYRLDIFKVLIQKIPLIRDILEVGM